MYLICTLYVFIIGEFHHFEGDGFVHPVTAAVGRVWVFVFAINLLFITPANCYPLRLQVLVSLVICRKDVQLHGVSSLGIKTRHFHGKSREHSPVVDTKLAMMS